MSNAPDNMPKIITVIFFLLAMATRAGAQAPAAGVGAIRARTATRAPAPPPVAPATVSRTSEGAITIRAVRIPEGIHLDGRLDEPYYQENTPISGFIQQEPTEGAPATEKTEAWIFYDDENIYVSARCWDSHPERDIANEMRRDSQNILQNENFAVIFDTFHDKRNGVHFRPTRWALNATRQSPMKQQNMDWNTVWDVKTQRFEQGWTAEFAIPFKSLRYDSSRCRCGA